MNHKRKRPKNRRAGCLLCKPHKANGVNECVHSERRAFTVDDEIKQMFDEFPGPWYVKEVSSYEDY